MKIAFTVHGVSIVPVNMPATIDGIETMAAANCLEVELTSDKTINGSLTLRFFGPAIQEAQALFAKDASISADFAAAATSVDEAA